jgi:hypothetical protein
LVAVIADWLSRPSGLVCWNKNVASGPLIRMEFVGGVPTIWAVQSGGTCSKPVPLSRIEAFPP